MVPPVIPSITDKIHVMQGTLDDRTEAADHSLVGKAGLPANYVHNHLGRRKERLCDFPVAETGSLGKVTCSGSRIP